MNVRMRDIGVSGILRVSWGAADAFKSRKVKEEDVVLPSAAGVDISEGIESVPTCKHEPVIVEEEEQVDEEEEEKE